MGEFLLRILFIHLVLIMSLVYQTDSFRIRKEMFYLATHSTHFIYGYMASVFSNKV